MKGDEITPGRLYETTDHELVLPLPSPGNGSGGWWTCLRYLAAHPGHARVLTPLQLVAIRSQRFLRDAHARTTMEGEPADAT